ncbi:uncharacterized protein LOC129890778 [Solanum dulcamara]|uniref:uncharacterized protein LOC129890778 n=1 Tax=Solanum dulcamara TaxID=45834 RepID=UPI002484EAEC|nr:uncharacterized protein LOC129890778 [Solanum dulcamara]
MDGTCKKEIYIEELWGQRERVNAIVLSWLMNSVLKSLLSGIAFSSSASNVWTDLQERFDRVDRSRTYSLHKEIATLKQDSAAMYSRGGSSSGVSNRFKKNTLLIYDFCKCRGHTKKSYYKIVGYPPDFKSKRKIQSANTAYADTTGLASQPQQSVKANFSYDLNTNITGDLVWGRNITAQHTIDKVSAEASTSNKTISQAKKDAKQLNQGCTFKKDQYEHILKMMSQQSGSKVTTSDCNKANTASTTLFVTENSDVWIVDTGATNHIVSKLDMLQKESVLKLNTPKDICLSNGGTTQELYTGKMKEVGKESDTELWHQRLGHVSSAVLAKMFTMNKDSMCKYAKNQFGKVVKVLRSDNGTEFVNSVCDSMFKALGIIYQRCCPYTPQQNGVAKRKHRHFLEVTRALRFQAKIPIRFWGHCVLAATYLINRIPSSVLEFQTPYERLYGIKPVLSHLRIIGCLALAKHLTEHDKLMSRSKSVVHMGYSEVHKGRDVIFREDIFLFAKDDIFAQQQLFVDILQGLGGEQFCVQQPKKQLPTDASGSEVSHTEGPIITRRSTRAKQPPLWLKDFVSLNVKQDVQYPLSNYVSYSHFSPTYQCFIAATSTVTEPNSYVETIKDPRWVKAIQAEIQALESNHTWEITSLPAGKKPIGCR